MNNFNCLDYPEFPNLLLDLDNLLKNKKIEWTSNQICLNSIESEKNNYKFGVGSLIKDWNNYKKIESSTSTEIIVPRKKIIHEEKDFRFFCDVFSDTGFEKIYNFLLNLDYDIGRVRLMKLEPKTCLSWHRDVNKRIHYVLKSNIGNKMVIEDECLHLENNKWYLTDTTKYHTVFNGSMNSRIHLVASIL